MLIRMQKKMSEQNRTKLKKAAYLAALSRRLGVKTLAMKDAEIVSRNTLKVWRETDPDFAEAEASVQYEVGDFVENALIRKINDGDTTAIIFYCKTKLRTRGYVERKELTGADGAPMQITGIRIVDGNDKE